MRASFAVLARDPLHRVAGAAAELVGSGGADHDLGRDDAAGANDEAHEQQREDRPSRARRGQPVPEAAEETT